MKSRSKKTKKFNGKINFSVTRVVVFLLLSSLFLGLGFGFKQPIEIFVNNGEVSSSQIDYSGLVVNYINVGQGDSILIQFPDNKKMLIDAGPETSADKILNYLNKKVYDYNDDKTFDYLLLTHSDADHCGAMAEILNEYDAEFIFRPRIYSQLISGDGATETGEKNYSTTQTYANTLNAFYNENCPVVYTDLSTANSIYKIEGGSGSSYYQVVFYAPTLSYYSSTNDYSPIFAVEYNNRKFLFTGDASTESENLVMEQTQFPKIDVLKVAHHGSSTSTSLNFLNEIMPTYSIISVGKNNSYGHPTQDLLNRLNMINSIVFRTDLSGDVVANVNSTSGNILISTDSKTYVYVEYILIGTEMVLIYFCFFVSYKKQVKKK